MKQAVLILTLCFFALTVFAQKPEIQNTRLSFSPTGDSLIVTYDLLGNTPVFDVTLDVHSSLDRPLNLVTITGDLGANIFPGTGKQIIWNMQADEPDIFGSNLWVKVLAKAYLPSEKEQVSHSYFPWLFVASGVSAITGGLAWYQANSLYDKYPHSSQTDQAEQYRSDVKRYDMVRNIAFGMAGAFAVAGVVVHIRHKKRIATLNVYYLPLPDGNALGLQYNF